MSDMDAFRERINDLDETLMRLLAERFTISHAVGQYKRNHDLPILDSDREARILSKAAKHGSAVLAVYEAILAQSRAVQEKTP